MKTVTVPACIVGVLCLSASALGCVGVARADTSIDHHAPGKVAGVQGLTAMTGIGSRESGRPYRPSVTLGATTRNSGGGNLSVREALPRPALALTGISLRTVSGNTLIEASLSVSNYARYPDSLFAPAPELPPCGSNTNASRTWVDIYNARTSRRIYGFCALTRAKDLTRLWFSASVNAGLPSSVYVQLNDRKTGQVGRSNNVSIH